MTVATIIIKIHMLYGLTYRQCQVALLASLGVPYKAAGEILSISQSTVDKLMTQIHEKLSISHTSQLIHRLIADGAIEAVKDWTPYTNNNLKALFKTIPKTGSGQSINTLRKLILANEPTTNS